LEKRCFDILPFCLSVIGGASNDIPHSTWLYFTLTPLFYHYSKSKVKARVGCIAEQNTPKTIKIVVKIGMVHDAIAYAPYK
jgi:hypothetical protein